MNSEMTKFYLIILYSIGQTLKRKKDLLEKKNQSRLYYTNDYKLIKYEGKYNFLNFTVTDTDFDQNEKIGALDFESYGVDGLGNQNVYAGGWCFYS